MKTYGRIYDGDIIEIVREERPDTVEVVRNYAWLEDDFSDREGGWVRVERLAEEFAKMCKKTGMTRKAIAGYCGITPATLWNYTSGKSPVPAAVWRSVEELQRL